MPDPNDPIIQKLITNVQDADDDSVAGSIKNLKTYVEACKLLEPDPIPEPEPSGVRGFFHRHAGDLIKAGTTLSVVGIIAIVEAKGDVIFRSKATKFL